MDLDYQFDSIKNHFQSGGCSINHANGVVTATAGGSTMSYNLPPLLQANNGSVPGWFLAGIWDDMDLPNTIGGLDTTYLSGWGFAMPDRSQVWMKRLPADKSKVLIYAHDKFYITDYEENLKTESRLPRHADFVADMPKRSIYHVIQLFEENAWFDNESRVPSQQIGGYRR